MGEEEGGGQGEKGFLFRSIAGKNAGALNLWQGSELGRLERMGPRAGGDNCASSIGGG